MCGCMCFVYGIICNVQCSDDFVMGIFINMNDDHDESMTPVVVRLNCVCVCVSVWY